MKNNLKVARKSIRLTQEEVADKLSVSQKAISTWETGAKEPSFSTLIKLADLYKVSIDFLLNHDTQMQVTTSDIGQDELSVLDTYRSLNPQGQEYIRQQLYLAGQIYKKSTGISGMEAQNVG